MKNKRGDFTGVLFLVVMIAAFAIFLLIVGYITPVISDNLISQIGISEEINNSFLASSNTAHNTLPTLWFIMFGGLLIALIITAYFIPSHPVFIIPYFILLGVVFLVSIALSNAYEALYTNATFTTAAQEQTIIYFIMSNLPLVSLIVGVLIMVISFAKPSFSGGSNVVPV